MAEKNECKEQVVNVGFVNRQEDKRQIHLRWGEKEKREKIVGKKCGLLLLFLKSIIEIASIALSELMVFSSYHHPVCLLLVFIQL